MLSCLAKLKSTSRVPSCTLLAVTLLGAGPLMTMYSIQSSLTEQVAQDINDSFRDTEASPSSELSLPPRQLNPVPSEDQHDELLWLARCIYSETKRPIEQLYVGWVVRNRVESQYRGKQSYRDIVLDPYQFSAFNTSGYTRTHYTSLDVTSDRPGWQQALRIARYVMDAPPSSRPFSLLTRHFYSERSMNTNNAPHWSREIRPIQMTEHEIDRSRFRFFTGIL